MSIGSAGRNLNKGCDHILNVNIIAVGKLKEKYLLEASGEYEKRLSRYVKLNIIEIPEEKLSGNPSQKEIAKVLCLEGEKIIKAAGKSILITLCIEGKAFSSIEFAERIEHFTLEGESEISFVIGSSFGISDEVKSLSKLKISISKMTFPHQLCRIVLLEQVYRTMNILGSGKYHK